MCTEVHEDILIITTKIFIVLSFIFVSDHFKLIFVCGIEGRSQGSFFSIQTYSCLIIFFFFFFGLFRAAPTAYGSSQVRDPIRAIATGLHHSHSNRDLSHVCDLHHSLWRPTERGQELNLHTHQFSIIYYQKDHELLPAPPPQ